MKPNRRSLKIKTGASVVDVKLSGRVEKAQSFAKAVICSLFLLVSVGLYVRWDTLMELRNSSTEMKDVVVEDVVVGVAPPQDGEFANNVNNMKTSLQLGQSGNLPPLPPQVLPHDGAPYLTSQKQKLFANNVNNMKKHMQQEQSNYLPPLPPQVIPSGGSQVATDTVGVVTDNRAVFKNAPISQNAESSAMGISGYVRTAAENFKPPVDFKTVPQHVSQPSQAKRVDPKKVDQPQLLTENSTVSASVNGNLGLPSVVISRTVNDWLKDRWQAAKDMTGAPIPGAHWIQFDLHKPSSALQRIVIDFEVALSNDYVVEIFCISLNKWQSVHDTRVADASSTAIGRSKMHIIHDIAIKDATCNSFSKIKLKIRRPATRFGTSIWRFEAYGSVH